MLLEKFIQGWQSRRTRRLATVGAGSTVSRRKAGKLAAVGVTVGLVTSMGIGALTQSPSIEDFFADSETVTEADLSAGVLEGSATTDRDNAVTVLMGQGMSKDEARAYADELLALESGVSAKDEVAANNGGEKSDSTKGVGGAAGLSKSASLSKNNLPALSPAIRSASSGDGNSINDVRAFWLVDDDNGTSVDNADCSTDDLLCLMPSGDSIRDLRLQLEYSLSGENNYAPGELRITVPAKIFTQRESDTSSNLGNRKAGAQIIPYPEAPRRNKDFNWEFVKGETDAEDHYVLTNTRALSAATKGFIQFGLVDNPAAHNIVDMSLSGEWQATVEVITKQGNTLSSDSNALQVQVNTHQNLGTVTKSGRTGVLTPASRIAGRVPEGVELTEDEYIVVTWTISVPHSGNQPFILDLHDVLDADNNPYNGFILGATSNAGLTYDNEVFRGWTSSSSLQFTVQTAYPVSNFPECGKTYSFSNKTEVTLTPLDGIDPVQKSDLKSGQATYKYDCPVSPTDPPPGTPHFPIASSYGQISGSYQMYKYGNDGEAKDYRRTGGVGLYKKALNELRDGKDVDIDYDIHVYGTLLKWLRGADDNEWVVANYTKPVTVTTTDTGVTMLNESGLRAGRDWEFVSVNITKPEITKPRAVNLNDDGSLSQPTGVVGTITTTSDNDPSHIPDIKLEAKVGTTWKNVATVKYSTGTCQVTYDPNSGVTGGSPTDCAHVKLPANTTQFRTVIETNVASIDYMIYPKLRLKASTDMVNMATNSFQDSNGNVIYNPLRYMRDSATLMLKRADGTTIGTIDRQGDNELRGFLTDTKVYAEKSARSTARDANYNDYYTTIHYSANVKEDWFIPDADLWREAAAEGEIEPLASGVWYDLLPKGVYPMTNTIRVEGGANITSVRTINDYNDSGRVLLIVGIERAPNLSTYTIPGDNARYVRDTTSISFDARYDFTSIIEYGMKNLHNVISFEAGKNPFGTVAPYVGEPDDPRAGNHEQTARAFAAGDEGEAERDTMTDLNRAHDNPSFVYAGATHNVDVLSAATSSLEKQVMVNNDGIWQSGAHGEEATVYEGGRYAYRLSLYSTPRTISKDLIIYDSLENFQPTAENEEPDANNTKWHGTFAGIDVRQMREAGADPVVWYSIEPNLVLGSTSASGAVIPDSTNTVLDENGGIWSKTPPANLADVKAIAIDLQKTPEGEEFRLMPDKAVTAIVYMDAPPRGAAETTRLINENARAFNNAYSQVTTIDAETGGMSGNPKEFIRKDYTKVGLAEFSFDVSKQWDDDNNRDGKRPPSVTVRLLANGVEVDSHTLDASNEWKHTFRHLAYADDNGDPISYAVREDAVEGYTARIGLTGTNGAHIRNVHEPERITVQGTKTWANAEGAPIPEQITVVLKADGRQVQTKTVKPDANGNWSYEFTNLYKYRNGGTEIVYTVGEQNLGDGWLPSADGMNLTNTWHPYGDVVLSKTIEGATNATDTLDFSFRLFLLDADGNPLPEAYAYEKSDGSTGTVQHNGVVTLKDTHSLRIKELPMGAKVQAEEAGKVGFMVKDGALKEVTVEANNEVALDFTNVYKTSGAINLEASKTLSYQDLRRGQFVFEVYDEAGTLVRIAGNGADGTVAFGAFRYANADAGQTYTYTIKEKNTGQGGVTYSEAVYKATVTVTDNGDGTMSTSVTYAPVSGGAQLVGGKPNFVNEYHATGETALKAWKTLKHGTLAANQFSFDLYDANGTRLQTKKNTADGTVVFDSLQFNETHAGQTFLYVIREQAGNDPNVTYDTASVFGYQLEVIDQRDGTLGFNLTKVKVKPQGSGWVADGETDVDAVFQNEMKPGSLSVEKRTTDGSRDDLFHFKVKLTGEDVPTGNYNFNINAANYLPIDNLVLDELEVSNGYLGMDGYNGVDSDGEWGLGSAYIPLEQVFPEYNSNYTMVSGTLTSPSGEVYECETGTGRTIDCRTLGDGGGISNFGFSSSAYTSQIHFRVYSNFYGDFAPGLWVWNFQVTDGERIGFGSVSYLKYDEDSCTKGSDGKYVCNTTAAATSGKPAVLAGANSTPSDDFKVVLASSRESVNNSLVTTRSGGSEQARLLETVATTWSEDARNNERKVGMLAFQTEVRKLSQVSEANEQRPNIARSEANQSFFTSLRSFFASKFSSLNIKQATGDIVDSGTWGGAHYDLYSDGTLKIDDNSTINYARQLPSSIRTQVTRIEGDNITITGNANDMFSGCTLLSDISALSTWHFDSSVISMEQMFRNCAQLTDISVLSTWDMSNIQSMNAVFQGCTNLSILPTWNTSSVKNMGSMFYGCENLETMPAWDTSNVTKMSYMFSGCKKLKNLASWNTSNVTNMSYMFQNCSGLTSLAPLENWNTSSVTDMSAMFSGCSGLTSLAPLENWNTSQVTNMGGMFMNCTGLTSVEPLRTKIVDGVKRWDTSQVTNMAAMFYMPYNKPMLENVNALSEWDTSNVTSMYQMFYNCSKIENVNALSEWNTSKVTNMSGMFYGCGLTSVEPLRTKIVDGVKRWDTSKVTNMSDMFRTCSSLTNVDGLSGWDTSKVTSMSGMFMNCSMLENVNGLSEWDTSQVTNMVQMFMSCSKLTSLEPLAAKTVDGIERWNTWNVLSMEMMFSGCSSLSNLAGLENWNTSNLTSMAYMFEKCSGLENVDLSGWDTSKVTRLNYMFSMSYNNSKLKNVDLSGWNTSQVTTMQNMFTNCLSLTTVNISNWDMRATSSYGKLSFSSSSKLKELTVGPNTRLADSPLSGAANTQGTPLGDQWRNKHKEIVMSASNMVALINNSNQDGSGTWERVLPSYTVKFDKGEGEGSYDESVSVEVTEPYTIPSNADSKFFRPGYDFSGWATQKNGATVNLQACRHIVNGQTNYICQPDNLDTELPDADVIPANTMEKNDVLTLVAQWKQRDWVKQTGEGEYDLTLVGGEIATIDGIPAGTSYEVYEMTPKGWVLVQTSNTSGTIPTNGTASASFTNRPLDGVTTVQLEATKLFDGVAPKTAGQFEFNLCDSSNRCETVNDSAGGAVKFPQILIKENGVLNTTIPADLLANAFGQRAYEVGVDSFPMTFTISEKVPDSPNPSITYDSHSVTATISLDSNNQPVVTYSGTPVFENTTQVRGVWVRKNAVANMPTSVVNDTLFLMRVTIDGVADFDKKTHAITYSGVSGTPSSELAQYRPTTWDGGASGEMIIGVRSGETANVAGVPYGSKFSFEEIGWVRNGVEHELGDVYTYVSGNVANRTVADGSGSAAITNTYGSSGKLNLEAWKSLDGRELLEDEFEFELVTGANADGTGGTVIATTKNLSPDIRDMVPSDDSGTNWVANPHKDHALVAFDDIEITQAGTYTYTIREVRPDSPDPSIDYDDRSIVATVVATDNGDGTLSFTTTYEGAGGTDGNVFENRVDTGEATIIKTLVNADTGNEVTAPSDYKDAVFLMRVQVENSAAFAENTHPIVYSGAAVSGSQYRPGEWDGSAGTEMIIGVRAGESATIENIPVGTNVTVDEVGWELDGVRHNLGDIFSAYDTGSGAGHDETTVTSSTGELIPKDCVIANTYSDPPPTPREAPVQIVATKQVDMDGGTYDLKDGQFSFELLDEYGEVVATGVNAADGTVSFGSMSFSEADAGKEFIYTIREVVPDDANLRVWRYDEHTETVAVAVDFDTDTGELVASADYDSDGTTGAEFTNEYVPVGYLALRADKEVTGEGATLADGDFEFTLLAPNGSVIGDPVYNADDGSIYFPTITYGASDIGKTYTYQIKETKGDKAGWTYDEHTEYVTVTITDNGGAMLAVDATYYAPENASAFGAGFTADPNDDSAGFARFTNSYEFNPPAAGFTLSDTTAAALLLMLFAGLLGAGYTVSHLRKRGR